MQTKPVRRISKQAAGVNVGGRGTLLRPLQRTCTLYDCGTERQAATDDARGASREAVRIPVNISY